MSERAVRMVLRLHPAAYRREWGEEIAAVFADTTTGAGRWATVRELFDLAGQGVRRRLGLSSSGIPAELAAMVAPFAAVAAAGPSLLQSYALVRVWVHGYRIFPGGHGHWIEEFWLGQASNLLFLIAAVGALAGWWTVARLVAPLGTVPLVASQLMSYLPLVLQRPELWTRDVVGMVALAGPQVLWVLMLLAAPPDLLGPATVRRNRSWFTGVVVGVMWGQMFSARPLLSLGYMVNGETFSMLLGACELALLLVAVPALMRGRYGPAAAALAGAPIGFVMFLGVVNHFLIVSPAAGWALLGVVAVAAVAASRWRPTVPDRRPPTAG